MNPAGATANFEVLRLNYRISSGTDIPLCVCVYIKVDVLVIHFKFARTVLRNQGRSDADGKETAKGARRKLPPIRSSQAQERQRFMRGA